MGYRANIRTKSIIEYGGCYFKYMKGELAEFLKEECPSFYDGSGPWDDNLGECWEVLRDDVIKMIDNIRSNSDPEEELMDEYTAKELIEIFESWLEQTSKKDNFNYPEYIYIDWF